MNQLKFNSFPLQLNSKTFSTVADNTIKIVFIDEEGNKATVPGYVGQTILDIARRHHVDIAGICGGRDHPDEIKHTENWVETVYGSGPTCCLCMVKISSKYNDILPYQTKAEVEGLIDYWDDEYRPTSRLACCITVDKRHDGMVVFVPDAPPTTYV
eukprot:gene17881-23497_t